MSSFMMWKYISECDIDQLESTLDATEVKDKLKSIFLFSYADARKCTIATDFQFYNYAFCKERGFSSLKIATFLSICNEVWLRDTTDSLSERITSFENFKMQLLRHSVENSPLRYDIFLISFGSQT